MALFTSLDLGGAINLQHRVVLAPLTRLRAEEGTFSTGGAKSQTY